MGCGCGKKFSNPGNSASGQRVTSLPNTAAQTPANAANVVRSAPVPQGLRQVRPGIVRGRV